MNNASRPNNTLRLIVVAALAALTTLLAWKLLFSSSHREAPSMASASVTPAMGGAAAPTEASASVPAATGGAEARQASKTAPSLQPGAYISGGTCGNASNSTLMWFNGEFFRAGRMSDIYPRPAGSPSTLAGTMIDSENNRQQVTFSVLNPRQFVMRNSFGSSSYHFCPDWALPEMWRGQTPS
jgi:hypothetical protein